MASEHWLKRPVVVGLSAALVVLYGIAWGRRTLALARAGWVDESGMPFGGDFVTFWAASRLAIEGRAGAAFDPETFFVVQDSAIPGNAAHFLWNYPPMFHLLVLPFGLVDMVSAVWLWWFVTLPLFLVALYALVPRWETLVVGLSGSAVLLNLAHGQNGFLLVAIMVGGLALVLRDRPVWGGILLGCLAIKPHYGVLLPVAFLASRNSRAFIATGLSLFAWTAASTFVFGPEYWRLFADNLSVVGRAIDGGDLPPTKIVTPYVMAQTLGLGAASKVVHGVVALGCVLAVGFTSWKSRPAAAIAVLLVATTLFSPYLFDYDLILLTAAGAFLYVDRSEHGWVEGERELWCIAAIAPIAIGPVQLVTGVQVGPLLTLVLLVVAVIGAARQRNA